MLDEDAIYELESASVSTLESCQPMRSMPLTSLERIVFTNCNSHFNLLLVFER